MGQKVHPIGFRLGVIKKHNALWYAKGKAFKINLIEDLKVRNYIKERLRFSSISKVDLERSAQNFVVNIHTSRPGIIIGKKGEEIESLKSAIQKLVTQNVHRAAPRMKIFNNKILLNVSKLFNRRKTLFIQR